MYKYCNFCEAKSLTKSPQAKLNGYYSYFSFQSKQHRYRVIECDASDIYTVLQLLYLQLMRRLTAADRMR